MYRALLGSDYYAASDTPRAHQPASGLAGLPPAARRARGASRVHQDPFDRVGSWLYPYSASGRHSQRPPGHRAQDAKPGAERAANAQSGIVAVTDPCPPGLGSLQESRGFYHQIAFALPFGLASTHAGVWQCRPAVTLSGRLTSGARSRASAVPSFSGPLHQPRAGIPARTDRTRVALLLWGGRLIVSAAIYSYMTGVIHPYYTNTPPRRSRRWSALARRCSETAAPAGGASDPSRDAHRNGWLVHLTARAFADLGICGCGRPPCSRAVGPRRGRDYRG